MTNENQKDGRNELNLMCTEQNEMSKAEVTNHLLALGVRNGDVLLVHTSFRATRPVEDAHLV